MSKYKYKQCRRPCYQRIRQAEQDGSMGAREARKARFQAELRKDKAYHPGYVEPLKAKGVTYMQTV